MIAEVEMSERENRIAQFVALEGFINVYDASIKSHPPTFIISVFVADVLRGLAMDRVNELAVSLGKPKGVK